MGGKKGWAAALFLLALVVGVANAGGRTLAVSPVTVQVLGKGTVTSSPAGVNCGNGATTCYLAFSGSGAVTLTASPATDWSFDSWANCPTAPVGNACDVPVDDNSHTVTANFTGPPTTTSTLSVTHTGAGNVSGGNINCGSDPAQSACSWTVLTGSTLTVLQEPAPNNVFTGWGGACTGTNVACTVELAGDRSVSAAWVNSLGVLLTVSVSGSGTVTGGGINCPPTCTATQSVNSTVILTATPAAGQTFTEWGGACDGNSSTTCAVLMDDAKSVTATFAPVVQLNVTVSGAGNVSGGSGTINCGGGANLCSASFALNETVSLTATPAAGATFSGWGGVCGGTATTCTVLMDATKSVTVSFASGVELSVTVSGNGNVSGGSGAISCGLNANVCKASFALNASVSLTATPATGATFMGWSGACGGISTSCTILMTGSKSVTATFSGGAGTTVPLTVSVNGPGTVTGGGINCGSGATACTANQTLNASVTVTATPGSGATFSGWGGACSGTTATCTVSMTSAKTVTATFSGGTPSTVPLTVTVTGRGRVTGGGINCGSGATTCSANVTVNSSITLTATPASAATFTGWGGACSGTLTTCTLTMNVAKSVSATFSGPFVPPTRTLTIVVRGPGTVGSSAGKCIGKGPRKTCVQQFSAGKKVKLTATPRAGARFRGWGGACTGTKRTCTVTLSTAKKVTATFSRPRPRP